ncbi:MAG: hexose kinase [Anaerococcus sp.]
MILTITANPSVDISYQLDEFIIDDVNRVDTVHKDAGGKGVHVGYVLNQLEHKVVNSGFVGGKIGEFISQSLENQGLISRFVEVDGETRNCIAILHQGKQTEILEKGPEVSKEKEEEFLNKLDEISKDCKVINVSGSLPKGLDSSFYKKIIAYAKENDKFISVDTSGQTLIDVINANIKPDLIKPNETEIKDAIGREIESLDDLIEILKKEPFASIENIIVSMGKDGALIKMGKSFYRATVPVIEPVNPVGSGDSALAGALSGINNKESKIDIIKKSMTCGLLNALNKEIARLDIDLFDKYYQKIKVKEL